MRVQGGVGLGRTGPKKKKLEDVLFNQGSIARRRIKNFSAHTKGGLQGGEGPQALRLTPTHPYNKVGKGYRFRRRLFFRAWEKDSSPENVNPKKFEIKTLQVGREKALN